MAGASKRPLFLLLPHREPLIGRLNPFGWNSPLAGVYERSGLRGGLAKAGTKKAAFLVVVLSPRRTIVGEFRCPGRPQFSLESCL
jgi:hypothetical protein